jgi:hypothetical protein
MSVQCSKCGLLGLRNPKSRTIEEVDEGLRVAWQLPLTIGADREDVPICTAGVISISSQVGHQAGVVDANRVTGVLKTKRNCKNYMEWMQGYNPREHKDLRLQQEARDQADRMAKTDRLWQLVLVLAAGILSLLGVALGSWISQQPGQPIHIHVDKEAVKAQE